MKTGLSRAFVIRISGLFALASALSLLSVSLIAFQTAAAPADDTPPVIDLTYSEGRTLRNDTVLNTADTTITCLVMDDLSEIEEVEYSIDGSPFKPTTNGGDIHRTSFNLNGLMDGNHSITVRAINNASLTAEKNVDFEIDSSSAPSGDLMIWNVFGAIVAFSGIIIALALIVLDSRKHPRPDVHRLREGEMPPIL